MAYLLAPHPTTLRGSLAREYREPARTIPLFGVDGLKLRCGAPDTRAAVPPFIEYTDKTRDGRPIGGGATAEEVLGGPPDVIGFGQYTPGPGQVGYDGLIVSERLRLLLEELDPAVADFVPIDLRRRSTGTMAPGSWYVLVMKRPPVDALLEPQSDLHRYIETCGRRAYGLPLREALAEPPRIFVRADRVRGMHLWNGANVKTTPEHFVSDLAKEAWHGRPNGPAAEIDAPFERPPYGGDWRWLTFGSDTLVSALRRVGIRGLDAVQAVEPVEDPSTLPAPRPKPALQPWGRVAQPNGLLVRPLRWPPSWEAMDWTERSAFRADARARTLPQEHPMFHEKLVVSFDSEALLQLEITLEDIKAEALPRLIMGVGASNLYPIVVGEEIKEAIERLDPSAPYFFPAEVRSDSGDNAEIVPGPWWHVLPDIVDGLVPELSTGLRIHLPRPSFLEYGGKGVTPSEPRDFVIESQSMGSSAVFIVYNPLAEISGFFVHDEIWNIFNVPGIEFVTNHGNCSLL